MGILKKLASQTAIYGLSSIFGRFLNYLLVPLYTYHFSAEEYGVVSEFYAYAGFFSVLLLCGFETGYFRFRDKENPKRDLAYSTALIFIVVLNLLFLLSIGLLNSVLSAALHYPQHPEYVLLFTAILSLDAISAMPFARLRAEHKAFRFAGIKLIEILVTVFLSLFFIAYCPTLYQQNPQSALLYFYQPEIGLGYVFIANASASVIKFLLLSPQLRGIAWGFERAVFIRLLRYSAPMAVVGFAGIINEMLDRSLLKYWLPYDEQTNMQLLGIYSACYKLSILMSLFIQAFRYAAEPFFFAYADKADARQIYADVLKYFVIFCVAIFLIVTLYLDFFKYFVGDAFRSGLNAVPILLLANLCLGVYVNLSIWYKLTDKTLIGAYISIAGALLTILLNVWWIPLFGYIGSAWATLACYGTMALVSYLLGQYFYPVAYEVKKIVFYILLGISLYGVKIGYTDYFNLPTSWLATELLLIYLLVTALLERQLWRKQP